MRVLTSNSIRSQFDAQVPFPTHCCTGQSRDRIAASSSALGAARIGDVMLVGLTAIRRAGRLGGSNGQPNDRCVLERATVNGPERVKTRRYRELDDRLAQRQIVIR